MKQIRFLLLAFLFFCVAILPFGALAATEAPAKNISKEIDYVRDGRNSITWRVNDNDLVTTCDLELNENLFGTSKYNTEIGYLYLRFGEYIDSIDLLQYDTAGNLLKESTLHPEYLYELVACEAGCVKFTLSPKKVPVKLCDIQVYGVGSQPEEAHIWQSQVARTDFLIITTHPDDECLFLGGVYPIYGGERKLTGTYAYITTPNYGRMHEALNGLWVTGVRTYPFFLEFPDVGSADLAKRKNLSFEKPDVILSIVRLLRQIKPLVVITQDPIKGEYGHWQHIIGANAAYDAVQLAADPTYDMESVEQYGVWEVKKLYQHLYPENKIQLDVTSSLSAYHDMTALEIAEAAFAEHVSQQFVAHRPKAYSGTHNDIDAFGLSYSAVGEDVNGNDMFENIDHNWLAASIANPTPEPTPEPTLEPTPTPVLTPKPTNTPQIASIPDVSDVKTTNDFDIGKFLPFILSGIILLLFVGISIGVSIHSKKR